MFPVSVAEWIAQPEDVRLELIDGCLIPKAPPTFEHGHSQGRVAAAIGAAFHRPVGGSGEPGGWLIALEVDVVLNGDGLRPDIAGWRRDNLLVRPRGRPVMARPDWICEIVGDSNRVVDTVTKLRGYCEAGVPYYWILDLVDRTLTVYRHTSDGYLMVLRAGTGERVRAEPFDAIELRVAELLGDDPEPVMLQHA